MQAMDEEKEPEPPMPNHVVIESVTTRLDLEPRPAGGGGLVLRLGLAMTECHTWRGIGARSGRVRRPRCLSRETSLVLDYLPSGDDDCRRRLGQAIKDSLTEEEEYRCLSPARWDEAVPRGIERALAVAAQRGGGGGTCEARVYIRFDFVYSEPEALLLACVENGGGDSAGRRGNGGDGDAPLCSICFEEMSREVTDLPGCTHGFHRGCIAAWFRKASTCPVCRRDQLQYLPPYYLHLHDVMTHPDSLPDYS